MSAPLTVVGKVVQARRRGLTVELDDGARIACDVPEDVRADLPVKGARIAVRATVVAGGDPHPREVRALALAADDTGASTDNELVAAVEGGTVARRADLPPPRRVREAPDERGTARAPYYRLGAGLAIAGGFLLGVGGARWGLTAAAPPAWASTAILVGLGLSVFAAAVAAGRTPLQLGRGQYGMTWGRPAWDVMGLGFGFGFVAACVVFMGLMDDQLGRATAPFSAMIVGAFGVGLTINVLYKLRGILAFGHRVFWGRPKLAGVVDGEGVQLRVRYVHRSSSREVQRRDQHGNTTWKTETDHWVEGRTSVTGARALAVKAGGRTETIPLDDAVRWSAPLRYAPPSEGTSAITVTRIEPGDRVVLVETGGDPHLFAAAGSPRAALLGIFLGHAARVAWLVLLTAAAFGLAAWWW